MSLYSTVSPSSLSCVLPYAKGTNVRDGSCDCNGGYIGSSCQEALAWWIPTQWALFGVSIAIMTILFLWSILKLVHMRFVASLSGKLTFIETNLALVSVLLNIVGNGLRLALRMVVLPHVTRAYDRPPSLTTWVVLAVVHSLSLGFAIASLGSILGFWLDALRNRLFTRMALRTKILCTLCAALSLFTAPGAILAIHESTQLRLLGYGLFLVPYCFSTVALWTITIIVRTGCCIGTRMADLSLANRVKILHVNRYATFASVAWTTLTASVVLLAVFKALPGFDTWTIVPITIAMFSESAAVWATMMLVERNRGPLKMLADFVYYSSRPLQPTTSTGATKSSRMDSASSIETTTPSVHKSTAMTPPPSLTSAHGSELSTVEEVEPSSSSDINASSTTTTMVQSEDGATATPASPASTSSSSSTISI